MFDSSKLIEDLESRTLLSASLNSALSTAVRADRLQIRLDLVNFKVNALSSDIKLLGDVNAMRRDDLAQAATIKPLIGQFRADLRQMREKLAGDRLTESVNVLADERLILAQLKKIQVDKANPTALAADRTQLRADRIQLQQDIITGLDARVADRQGAADTIFNDGQAIVNAVQTNSSVSPKLSADVQKWVADRTALTTKITTGLQKIMADRTQLVTDLTALQST